MRADKLGRHEHEEKKMRVHAGLFVALVATGAMGQLSDDQASEEIRATIPLIRNTFIVDEFDAEGLRGRDLYLDPPRTLVYEYEYNWALADSILTLEDMAPFQTVMENQAASIWCSEPLLKYWRDNDLNQTWLYRDSTGLMLFKVQSQYIDC